MARRPLIAAAASLCWLAGIPGLAGSADVRAGLVAAASAAVTTETRTARTVATLLSDVDTVAPGKPFHIALRLNIAPGWHTYWRNPGDGGVPPQLDLTLPSGVAGGPIAWPAPELQNEGPLVTYGLTGDVLLPVTVTATGAGPDSMTVEAHATWLVCAKICVPEEGVFRLSLVSGDGAPSPQASLFAMAATKMPRPAPWPARIGRMAR